MVARVSRSKAPKSGDNERVGEKRRELKGGAGGEREGEIRGERMLALCRVVEGLLFCVALNQTPAL